MAINRKLWIPSFASFPSWLCPSCQSGTLALNKETFINIETGLSEKSHDHEAWDPEWIDERFVGLLVCQNAACGEMVAIGGRSYMSENADWECQERSLEREFAPNFMYPAPSIFPIPEECPKMVRNELKRAFSPFCGFELFEHVIELTYVKREQHLKKIARTINVRRGRPIRHRPAFR